MEKETYKLPIRPKEEQFALVSAEDYMWARQFKWYVMPSGYVWRMDRLNGKQRTVYLHRDILGLKVGDKTQADHINRDRLDNRRENLRAATHAQNHQNRGLRGGSSKYRGVGWHKASKKWRARVMIDQVEHYLGGFATEEEAAEAAKAYRLKHMSHATD